MDWDLLRQARTVEDVAAGLQIFADEIPQRDTDISASMDELFTVSSLLRALDDALYHSPYVSHIRADVDLVINSLEHTLGAVKEMFGETRFTKYSGAPPYRMIWEDFCTRLRDNEGPSLYHRLEMYSIFLGGLLDVLKGRRPRINDMGRLHDRIARLLSKQEPLEARFERFSFGAPEPRSPMRPRTPLRPKTPVRPPMNHFQTFPAYGPYMPPPPHSPMSDDWEPFVPPFVPDVPQSPTFSSSSQQTYSSAQTWSTGGSSGSGFPTHWATRIFDGRHSSTPFLSIAPATECFGRREPMAMDRLFAEGFVEVLKLPFEATDVYARLFWRPLDSRARLLIVARNVYGQPLMYCMPLTALKARREGSCLQLHRVDRDDGQLQLWANLKFTLYERMVLFYCTFVAMKGQDRVEAPPMLQDWFQAGEKLEFCGEIEDEKYLHAFRIFRDRDSGGVRFEATARRGSRTQTPIWTAFVTKYIGSHPWTRRVGQRTVQFNQLHPYVFCDYMLPRSSSGHYQLQFTSPEDAEHFIKAFHSMKVR